MNEHRPVFLKPLYEVRVEERSIRISLERRVQSSGVVVVVELTGKFLQHEYTRDNYMYLYMYVRDAARCEKQLSTVGTL